MKQAEPAELKRRIEVMSKASALGAHVKHIDVEAGEDGEADCFLRVSLHVDHLAIPQWDEVEPLVDSIEESVDAVDGRVRSAFSMQPDGQ